MIEIPTLVEEVTQKEILLEQIINRAADGMTYVEVGCFIGGTFCYVGQRLVGKNVRMVAVDNWECSNISDGSKDYVGVQDNFYEEFKNNLKKCDLWYKPTSGRTPTIEIIKGDSIGVSCMFPSKTIDFLFLDGAHHYPYVADEIRAWLPKIKAGGIICGHDYSDPSVKRGVNEVLGQVNISSNGASYWKQINGL